LTKPIRLIGNIHKGVILLSVYSSMYKNKYDVIKKDYISILAFLLTALNNYILSYIPVKLNTKVMTSTQF